MYHRYGRHGPRAWLRRHKKRIAPPTTAIVPVVRPITVRIFIPANAERIIFIVAEDYTDDNTQQRYLYLENSFSLQRNADEQPVIPANVSTSSDGVIEILAKSSARKQALINQRNDIQLSEDELDSLALQNWIQDSRDPQLRHDIIQRNFEQAEEDYCTTYKAKYKEVSNLPVISGIEGKIRQLARDNKKQYTNTLSPDLVALQATSQMVHYVPPGLAERIEYLTELDRLVKIYISYYDEYTPQPEREVQATDQYNFRGQQQW